MNSWIRKKNWIMKSLTLSSTPFKSIPFQKHKAVQWDLACFQRVVVIVACNPCLPIFHRIRQLDWDGVDNSLACLTGPMDQTTKCCYISVTLNSRFFSIPLEIWDMSVFFYNFIAYFENSFFMCYFCCCNFYYVFFLCIFSWDASTFCVVTAIKRCWNSAKSCSFVLWLYTKN